MKSRSAFKPLFIVLLVAPVFAIQVLADDVPVFSDPDVNTYVRAWSQQSKNTAAAYELLKADALSSGLQEMQALLSKAQELAQQAPKITRKVKPDERETFMRYIMQCQKKDVQIFGQMRDYIRNTTGARDD